MTEKRALMEIESSTMSDAPDVEKETKFSQNSLSKTDKALYAIAGSATLGFVTMVIGVFAVLASFGFLAAGYYLSKNEGFVALMKAAKVTTALEAIKDYMEFSVQMKKRYYEQYTIDQRGSEDYRSSIEDIV